MDQDDEAQRIGGGGGRPRLPARPPSVPNSRRSSDLPGGEQVVRLVAREELRALMRTHHIPVQYVDPVQDNVFLVYVEAAVTPAGRREMLRAIRALPGVAAVARPPGVARAGILHITMTGIPRPRSA